MSQNPFSSFAHQYIFFIGQCFMRKLLLLKIPFLFSKPLHNTFHPELNCLPFIKIKDKQKYLGAFIMPLPHIKKQIHCT